ncbi:MAG: hypothetical protein ACLQLH_02110, partial [Terracidiphilus sp.]
MTLNLPVKIPVPIPLSTVHCSLSLPFPCDPEYVMKIFIAIIVILVVAGSLFADYKWRQWIAARRRNRQ